MQQQLGSRPLGSKAYLHADPHLAVAACAGHGKLTAQAAMTGMTSTGKCSDRGRLTI